MKEQRDERRLDLRILRSKPYETAMATPRMATVATALRPILTFVQCGVVILALRMTITSLPKPIPALTAAIGTCLYLGVYVVRWLPHGNKLSGRQWWLSQLVAGLFEIGLLFILDATYRANGAGHIAFWWALYILPVYRLAEVGGIAFGLGSFVVIAAWLLAYPVIARQPMTQANWGVTIVEVGFLATSTLLPFFIFRLSDLQRQASRFWYPLALRFIASYSELAKTESLLKDVFEKGSDNLVAADQAVLWELDTTGCRPMLRAKYRYLRPYHSHPKLEKWVYQRKPGTVSSDTALEVPASAVLMRYGELSLSDRFFADSRTSEATDGPWVVSKDEAIQSWLVVPVRTKPDGRLLAFLEIGLRWRLKDILWLGFEDRTEAIALALGEVYERLRQIRMAHLRESLVSADDEAENEADLYRRAAPAISQYYQQPVLIADYAFTTGSIQAYAGDIEPRIVSWLQEVIRAREQDLRKRETFSVCRMPDCADETHPTKECYFICPLVPQTTKVDIVVLLNYAEQLTDSDQEVLTTSVRSIGAALARRRARLLAPFALAAPDSESDQRLLYQLATDIKDYTAADVVVLYEFDGGRPTPSPIIVGELNDRKYLSEKPIVIEEPNPLLIVAREHKPIFYPRIQDTPLGQGTNRHHDPVFAVREAVVSSVGLPLRNRRKELIGVAWANYRHPQKFDKAQQGIFRELFRELPDKLEGFRLARDTGAFAKQSTQYWFGVRLHDGTLQRVSAAGGQLTTAMGRIKENQPRAALRNIKEALDCLEQIQGDIRAILDQLHEATDTEATDAEDIDGKLRELCGQLRYDYGFPQSLRTHGLGAIPPGLQDDLYMVIAEAIRNAAKHGQARSVVVQADAEDGMLQLVIHDDGRGFDAKPENYGYGIKLMKGRVSQMKGTWKILSKPGGPTSIFIERIPIPQESIQ